MERNSRKTKIGTVISDKMDKTIVVSIVRDFRHPLYKKVMRLKKRLKAHDETNECRVGDKVKLMETKPLSKEKHWRVMEIVEKAK